jgi:hypothetical protein
LIVCDSFIITNELTSLFIALFTLIS